MKMNSPPTYPTDLDDRIIELVIKFLVKIKNGSLKGPNSKALATITLIEEVINGANASTALELLALVKGVGRAISKAMPRELVPPNVVRRVLRAIRDETARSHSDQNPEGSSLQHLVLATGARRATLTSASPQLDNLREHIAELRNEVESGPGSICRQGVSHLHSGDLVLACGGSQLCEDFLKAAATNDIRLIVVEGGDMKQSASMAARLADAGTLVTFVHNESVMALMSRVNKVVLDVEAVLAGGSVLGKAGTALVTLAAKYYSVPVLALAPLYKLTPLHAGDRFNALTSPHLAINYELAESVECQTYHPLYDTVQPDHINLFLTNNGASSPTYIYRLLSDLYDANDRDM